MGLLQIVIGTLLVMNAHAKRFSKDCLLLSEKTLGNENVNDRSISNDVQLITDEANSSMRMHQITTCMDEESEVTGI